MHLCLGVTFLSVLNLARGKKWHISKQGMLFYQWWMGRTCRILGLEITQYGQAHHKTVLHAANHVSFLDIIVIGTSTPARFISKHTVRYWPLIGYLSACAGTIFIRRGKRSSLHQAKETLITALRLNRPLAIFPEGTTTLGEQVEKFHSGLFQAAIDTQTPVQPIAIRYIYEGKLDRTAAYIDKDNFIISLLKLIHRPVTSVHLAYCPVIEVQSTNRQALATQSHSLITSMLDKHLPVNSA